MRPPAEFVQIIDRVRYDVRKAELVAGDDYWDGHNWERSGRNTWLYKTPKGRYFTVTLTQWQGERDTLRPVTVDDAIALYEGALSEHELSYAEAFPGVKVEDA
jgi:hypothetical protein